MEIIAAKILHYYGSTGVARIIVSSPLKVGDRIHIKGNTTDFDQWVESLEVCHRQVQHVSMGETAGMKVNDYVRKNDRVYRIEKIRDQDKLLTSA